MSISNTEFYCHVYSMKMIVTRVYVSIVYAVTAFAGHVHSIQRVNEHRY